MWHAVHTGKAVIHLCMYPGPQVALEYTNSHRAFYVYQLHLPQQNRVQIHKLGAVLEGQMDTKNLVDLRLNNKPDSSELQFDFQKDHWTTFLMFLHLSCKLMEHNTTQHTTTITTTTKLLPNVVHLVLKKRNHPRSESVMVKCCIKVRVTVGMHVVENLPNSFHNRMSTQCNCFLWKYQFMLLIIRCILWIRRFYKFRGMNLAA